MSIMTSGDARNLGDEIKFKNDLHDIRMNEVIENDDEKNFTEDDFDNILKQTPALENDQQTKLNKCCL